MLRILAISPVIFAIAGCHARSGRDDVLASVNGDQVTRADVTAELATRNLRMVDETMKVPPALLAAMVDRRLLAGRAKAEGVETEANYAAIAARAQETALAQQLLARWRTSVPVPSNADARAFVDSNPHMFASRVIYLSNDVETSAKGLDAKKLEPLQSMDAVEAYLRDHDRPFQRGSTALDTMTLGSAIAHRIAALRNGEPFADVDGANIIVRSVIRVTPAPITGAVAIKLAARLLRQRRYEVFVQQQLQALRSGATITYPSTAVPA